MKIPLRLLLVLCLWLVISLAQAQPSVGLGERERTFEAVVDLFRRYYWDGDYTDWQEWAHQHREEALSAPTREAFDLVLGRMIARLGDEHSAWLGLDDFHGERGGDFDHPGGDLDDQPRIGFSSRSLPDGTLLVDRVFPGSAAAAAGLRRGDVVTRIDGEGISGMSSWLVRQLLGRAAGSERVELLVRRGRAEYSLEVAPAPFPIETARQLPQGEMLDERMGYIYLPSFNRPQIAAAVHELLSQLQGQGLSELVLDLRGNPGGRLTELGLTLGAFIDGPWIRAVSQGEVAWQGHYGVRGDRGFSWLEEPDGRRTNESWLDSPARFRGPLAVIVDRRNSSAGELAAAVLQSRGRAVVVGEPTGGNVEAVRGFDLPDGSVVMVAIANLEGVDGSSFTEGISPDRLAREDLGELALGYDAPLAEAIRLLRGLPFTPNRYFGAATAAGQGAP